MLPTPRKTKPTPEVVAVADRKKVQTSTRGTTRINAMQRAMPVLNTCTTYSTPAMPKVTSTRRHNVTSGDIINVGPSNH